MALLMQETQRYEATDTKTDAQEIISTLSRVFGFGAFRPQQMDIVQAILDKRDAFIVMPTGGGKSLCYQLPAHMMAGTCIVISPLISLMKDQVDAAAATGLMAAFLNSTQSGSERGRVLRMLAEGELDLLYVSPERFSMPGFVESLKQIRISFVAVDEAHCISEWGHDFRSDYLLLSRIIPQFPGVSVAAFTATATERVAADIIQRLGLRSPFKVRASFDRANLFYEVVPKENASTQLLAFVRAHPGEAGIIYRTTRSSVESTAEYLVRHGIKALPYHAGLDEQTRQRNQEAFNRDTVDVIVATIAFGMGIDKSNVRYVLHGDLPKNIEGYYQETGRAGRDGEPSHCMLLFSRGDITRIRYFIDQMTDPRQREHALACLQSMTQFAAANTCRRKLLLGYFNETYPKANCGTCDICTGGVEMQDATVDAQKILSAMARTEQRFGAGHIIDIVVGSDTARIQKLGHKQLKTFGAGSGKSRRHWGRIIDNLLAQDVIMRSEDKYPVLKFGGVAQELMRGNTPFHIPKEPDRAARPVARAAIQDYQKTLLEELRQTRRNRADAMNVPPFVIFSDASLREMAHYLPVTGQEFRGITGVGETKLQEFGDEFLCVIRGYVERHPGIDRPPIHMPERRHIGTSHQMTLAYVQQGLSLEAIAVERDLAASTIRKHIADLILSGQEVSIDRFITPQRRIEIEALFHEHDTMLATPIVAASNGTVTYEEITLTKAWMQRPS